jgi:UPF0755 protein
MSRRGRGRALGRIFGLLLACALVAAGWVMLALNRPYQGFAGETFLQIARGSGTRAIARQLADAGVVSEPWHFLAMRALHPRAVLQAGEYRFHEPASAREVFSRIERGDIFFFDVTVPEGSNIFDVARLVASQTEMSEEDFLTAASDPSSIRDLAPAARTLEGYLFPSTYRLTHSTTAPELCRLMTAEFRKQWAAVTAGIQVESAHATVTLASLVEKETGVPAERPLVASVFTNRLEKGMRLECDPTTIYAARLEHRYRGTIHQSDLTRHHPYNTYQNAGLPPGPIANPGAESLAAALHPAKTEFVYFVAKPDRTGGHEFSATLAAHERAVFRYRHGSPAKAATKAPRKKG